MFPGSRPAEGPVGAQAGGDPGGGVGVRSAALCPPALRQRPPAVAQSPQSGGSRDGCGFTGIPPTRGPPPALLGGSTQPLPHAAPVLRGLPGPAALPWGSAPHGPPKAGETEAIAAPCTSGALWGSRWGGGCQPCSCPSLRVLPQSPPRAATLRVLIPPPSREMGGGMAVTGSPRCCPGLGFGGAERGQGPPSPGPGGPRCSGAAEHPRTVPRCRGHDRARGCPAPRRGSGVPGDRGCEAGSGSSERGGRLPDRAAALTGGRPRTLRDGPEQGRFTGAAA